MKINKFAFFTAIAAAVVFVTACATADDAVKPVIIEAEEMKPVEQEEEQENNAIALFEEETEIKDKKSRKKNYTGWVDSSGRPITVNSGIIRISAKPKTGAFVISAMNENEKYIPVLSTANEYTTTSFYLMAGKKIFKLCDNALVVSSARKTDDGVRIKYSIDKIADVIIDMVCFSALDDGAADTIKITAAVQSKTKKKTEFALKFIADTVLGETDRHHFYTSKDVPVKAETVFYNLDNEKWIVSKNAKAAMQMIFAGKDCSVVDGVALANYTTLDTNSWNPDMSSVRSFDTVLSYNNSAVGVYWPKQELGINEVNADVFYISLATDGMIPSGAEVICAPEIEPEVEAESETVEVSEEKTAEPAVENIAAVEEPVIKVQEVRTEPEKVIEPVRVEPVAEIVVEPAETSKKDKLSSSYIQDLFDRIEKLQEGDPDLNKEELLRLNAELDAILNILNNM